MMHKLIIAIAAILSFSSSPALAHCEQKYSSSAYGNFSYKDWEDLKIENYQRNNSRSATRLEHDNPLTLWEVQQYLNTSGELVKSSQPRKEQHWIFIDRDNHNKRVNAIFIDNELTILKGRGFNQFP